MRHLIVLLLAAALVVSTSGCSKRFQRYVGSFGAVGAAVGGTTGAVTSASVNAGEGALMGATAGGLVGAIVADNFDDSDWEGMEAEIARLQSENNQLEMAMAAKDKLLNDRDAMLTAFEADLAEYQSKLADLEGRLATAEQMNQKFSRDYVELEAQFLENEDALKSKEQELAQLQDRLGQNIEVGQQAGGGITLTILDELLFPEGRADLSDTGRQVLAQAADTIRELYPGRQLVVEGHTDDQPIAKSHWQSNWELGAARSLSVLHHLIDNEAFQPERLTAVSYGETRPAVPNASPQARANNRRAVIVILPEETVASEAIATRPSAVLEFAEATPPTLN